VKIHVIAIADWFSVSSWNTKRSICPVCEIVQKGEQNIQCHSWLHHTQCFSSLKDKRAPPVVKFSQILPHTTQKNSKKVFGMWAMVSCCSDFGKSINLLLRRLFLAQSCPLISRTCFLYLQCCHIWICAQLNASFLALASVSSKFSDSQTCAMTVWGINV
jgi:hypothetical protein